MATLTETQIRSLPSYGWQEARKAYLERGERMFICAPRYPLHPKISLEPCGPFCCMNVIVEHRESNYLMIRCEKCRAETNGGLYHLGISDTPPKGKRTFGDLQRWNVMKRDGVKCFLCGAGPEDDDLEVDHIIPHCKGGPTDELNGITLCRRCNQGKSGTYDAEFVDRALKWTHKQEGQTLFQRYRAIASSLVAWGCKDLV